MQKIWLVLGTVLVSGCISAVAHRRPDPTQIFESADANKDGRVTRAEFIAAREQNFARFDRNGDGFIDANDLPRRLRARQDAQDRMTQLLAQFDSNGDGRVSRSEFVDGPTPLFDRADTDHNGELSREELQAFKAAVKNRRETRSSN